jgi:hypothetical protein
VWVRKEREALLVAAARKASRYFLPRSQIQLIYQVCRQLVDLVIICTSVPKGLVEVTSSSCSPAPGATDYRAASAGDITTRPSCFCYFRLPLLLVLLVTRARLCIGIGRAPWAPPGISGEEARARARFSWE